MTQGDIRPADDGKARLVAALAGDGAEPLDFNRVQASGVVARSAKLDGAHLEGADLADADMSGASLQGIVAGEVSFAGAMLEDASFASARMRFAKLPGALLDGAHFEGADLWGCDFSGADADDTVFRNARLDEADLSRTNLTGADFTGASLRKAKLVGARLHGAVFTDVKLDGADLSGADLSGTSLVRLSLASCNLKGVRFAGAWLSGTRMSIAQLGGAVGEEVAGEYDAARASYQSLERNLLSIGSKDEASWAYKKGRRMGRLLSGQEALAAARSGRWREAAQHGWGWAADRFVEWLCDYGESMPRIVRAFIILIFVFAALYGATGGLLIGDTGEGTHNALDLVSYSALNMLTSNTPDIGLKAVGRVTTLLVGLQGAVGIILMGLFGFVLGNRLRR